jgi:hypothetical protein
MAVICINYHATETTKISVKEPVLYRVKFLNCLVFCELNCSYKVEILPRVQLIDNKPENKFPTVPDKVSGTK